MNDKKQIYVISACVLFSVLAFADIAGFVDASRRGVMLFGRNVLPVLFPFFFISSLLIDAGFFEMLSAPFSKLTKKFYGTSGNSAGVLAVSLLSGYPTAARVLAQLYEKGEITRSDAIKTATFSSTCSPVFIIATMGVCLYSDIKLGALIFVAHTLGALVNGIVYRKMHFKEDRLALKTANHNEYDINVSISNSLNSAVQSIFAVGGLIIVFFIITAQIGSLVALPHSIALSLSSLLEMTNGVFAGGASLSPVIACAIVSFGGLCVTMQGFVFFKSFKMPLGFYLLYKTTHMILAAAICLILVSF